MVIINPYLGGTFMQALMALEPARALLYRVLVSSLYAVVIAICSLSIPCFRMRYHNGPWKTHTTPDIRNPVQPSQSSY